MSIYAVRLAEWYPKGDEKYGITKYLCQTARCCGCGKKHIQFQKAFGHHSVPFGHGDIWCTEKCFLRKYYYFINRYPDIFHRPKHKLSRAEKKLYWLIIDNETSNINDFWKKEKEDDGTRTETCG